MKPALKPDWSDRRWVWIDGEGMVLDRSPRWRLEGNALAILLQVNYTGNASVPLYRRSLVQQVGGYEEKLAEQRAHGCEDWDVALKVAEHYRVAVVPEVLAGYRRRPQSMSTSCDTMWRSRSLMIRALRDRNPSLRAGLFQQSADQFALYLAGISFWSGSYFHAICWGLRAWRSKLALQVLPHVVRMFVKLITGQRRASALMMRPGECLDSSKIPEPLIPYDQIYERLARSQMPHDGASP